MEEREVIEEADRLLRAHGIVPKWEGIADLAHNASLIKDIISGMTNAEKQGLLHFVEHFTKLYDRADKVISADPMVLYQPAHNVSLEFHSSPAFVRYYMAGNRTSKTQSGYAEHYYVATGQHKWRKFPARTKNGPMSTFIVGKAYSKYAPTIYEAKLVRGEQNNELSPIFPTDGKWFYHYDERKKIVQLACSECANAGKAQSCPHPKSRINLYSDEGGWENLMGTQYVLGHFDEHISEAWYEEAKQRLSVVPHSSLVITGTPQFGDEAWEIRKLHNLWLEGPPRNQQEDGTPIVSVHQISQFDAGLVPHDVIRRNMADMDEFEIESRIYGKPAPLARSPVFDRLIVAEQMKKAYAPEKGYLVPDFDGHLQDIDKNTPFRVVESEPGVMAHYNFWEHPEDGATYVIGVDTAKGLVGPNRDDPVGDASAASVVKLTNTGLGVQAKLVAQYYGWINPLDYADEVFKLANYYNEALVVIELTGGYGEATMLRMRQELYYHNLFLDESNHAQRDPSMAGRFGVETNQRTKPYMVSCLQRFLKDHAFEIPCKSTLREMLSFEQEKTEKNLITPRYRGVGGARDDRVMSLVIVAGVIAQQQVVDYVQFSAENRQTEYTDSRWKDLHAELAEDERIEKYE